MSELPSRRTRTRYVGVYQSSSGKYEIEYTDSNGERRWKTMPKGMKVREASLHRAQILRRMARGELVIDSKLTVRDLIEEYLRTQTAHLKPRTSQEYEYKLQHYVLPRLGNKRLNKLNVGDVAQFVVEMKAKGYKAWTIRGCLTPMSKMFLYAERQGWMSSNPVRKLDRNERPKSDQKQMEILNSDEIRQLLAASSKGAPLRDKTGKRVGTCDGTYHLLFQTAIFTGLRKGELLALTWDDIDLLNRIIRVREGKTQAAQREVVIPDFLVKEMAKWSLRQEEGDPVWPVFPFDKDNVNRALTSALKRAGVKHVRFHDLRHTYASMLVTKGVPVTQVSRLMGHANPAITLKVYAKLFEAENSQEQVRGLLEEVAG